MDDVVEQRANTICIYIYIYVCVLFIYLVIYWFIYVCLCAYGVFVSLSISFSGLSSRSYAGPSTTNNILIYLSNSGHSMEA